MKFQFKWEVIDAQTLRAKVPGGWLVRYHSHTGPVAMTVVADPKHDWEVVVLPEAVAVARERLAKLEHDLQDPYVDDAIKSEMQDEIVNLRGFIEQHE